MLKLLNYFLPHRAGSAAPGAAAVRVQPVLLEAAAGDAERVYQLLQTSPQGLTEEEAQRRQHEYGPNSVAEEAHFRRLKLFGKAVVNPLVILLLVLAAVSFGTGDARAGTVMLIMVALGVVLRFVQESRADAAADRLKAMIRVTATVVRDGAARELPLAELVPGDVVQLSAGDMIPADVRVVTCKDLHVIQATLTGESFPVEKAEAPEPAAGRSPLELKNTCYLGTSVDTGSARAVIVSTGRKTYLGSMASAIVQQPSDTSFDRGVSRFTWLMIRFIFVMVPLVFLINGLAKPDTFELTDSALDALRAAGMPAEVVAKLDAWKTKLEAANEEPEFVRRDFLGKLAEVLDEDERRSWQDRILKETEKSRWWQAFMFAVAVAVGLTPEMLPMIVTVCLSRGALLMSGQKVIVKRLNSIQNLGAMDVLCTDKTGTLTRDKIILEKHCDVVLRESEDVLALAYLNSYFQTGLKNVMDRAILEYQYLKEELKVPQSEKVDEIPFDFKRKVMSVVVRMPDGVHRLICKGAPEEVFRRCVNFELDDQHLSMQHMIIDDLREEYNSLSTDGFRVLALAYKDLPPKPAYSRDDESGLILKGYVAFLDPPKDSAKPAIRALQEHGVALKVLTGDNDLVSRKICQEVGLEIDKVLLGGEVERLSDEDLAEAAGKTVLFARLSPAHKQRIIKALQKKGHVVGFLGDGINDAPALRAADVGISVDTAVDIAKESADAILLEKSLMVLETGVVEGRKVFVNILKYIRMGASSNFGNMFSVLGASIFLPFLPMAPIQILANNLLYDFSQVPIPTDDVDPEQVARPRPWSMSQIAKFILLIGPCSSVFDYTTFFMMMFIFGATTVASRELFQTGWFVESLLTQTLIIHVIRTNRIPFLQSRASWPLIVTTALIMMIGIWLPTSFLAETLKFQPLPPLYWPLLVLTLFCYVVLTQAVKMWLLRRGWL
jgi:magnesium-transporting ATPase (P-type)